MTAPVLADALGPRARRRVLVASLVAGVVVMFLVAAALHRLQQKGQLDWRLWEPLTRRSVLRFLLGGLLNTLKAAAVSMAFSLAFGGLLALGRLARNAPVRWVAGAYVELFRALPLLLLILFTGLGLPKYGIALPAFWYLVIPLTAYNSAVLAEIFRAGILSLDRGQSEAALAIGLTYWQAMLLVVVPQAVRRMIPATISQVVTLLKDTSLGFIVIYEELLRRARVTGEFFRNPLQAVAAVALMYIVVNFALSMAARRLEVRQRRRYKAGTMHVTGIEELAVTAAVGEARLQG